MQWVQLEGRHPRLVLPIQYPTKCVIWSHFPLLFLSYGIKYWPEKCYCSPLHHSEVELRLFGYKKITNNHFIPLDNCKKFCSISLWIFELHPKTCFVTVTSDHQNPISSFLSCSGHLSQNPLKVFSDI